MQDPSGFPGFHDTPPPQGPVPAGLGAFSPAFKLTQDPEGGYRPQVAVGPDNRVHAVFYRREDSGDLIVYRQSADGSSWTAPEHLGFESGRNWGPDLIVRPDSTPVVVFDLAEENFRSRGYLTIRESTGWSTPSAITPGGNREVGSGHVANAIGEQLAYVNIGKDMLPEARFQAFGRWFIQGSWTDPVAFSDGRADTWHTNVERRPDGSVLAAFDVGPGGSETTLYLVQGRAGRFGAVENFSEDNHPGERAHFAFDPAGTDHVTWFHKIAGKPLHVYVRSGRPGAWLPAEEPSSGLGGYHFDPDIAINSDGVLCLIWGWDGGEDAEMLYSLNRGSGWEAPLKIADIDWGKPGLPSIAADTQGGFHVVWNQGIRGYNEVYYAQLAP